MQVVSTSHCVQCRHKHGAIRRSELLHVRDRIAPRCHPLGRARQRNGGYCSYCSRLLTPGVNCRVRTVKRPRDVASDQSESGSVCPCEHQCPRHRYSTLRCGGFLERHERKSAVLAGPHSKAIRTTVVCAVGYKRDTVHLNAITLRNYKLGTWRSSSERVTQASLQQVWPWDRICGR